MRILLASSHGIGCWFLLRLMEEGHSCDWYFVEEPKQAEKRVMRGLIPAPLDAQPDFSKYDLVIFDCTGHGKLADEARKVAPTIGDSSLATRLEDDRMYGIQVMEECGIEVPRYETFDNPEEAKKFISKHPVRFVYKPFEIPGEEDQDASATYVSESPDDMLKRIDQLFEQTMHAPFLLQEVVDGIEISTEAWFDGEQFFFHNHTIEKKKLMSGDYGPNTGCAGNLVWNTNPNRLFKQGLGKMQQFLADNNFRGMIDLNTILIRNHALGLEFTPRFGYDATASIFCTIQEHEQHFSEFLYAIATGPIGYNNNYPVLRAKYAASARYSLPPYPEEMPGKHIKGIPITGIKYMDIWHHWFLYDAMVDPEAEEFGLQTAGTTGLVCCPIAPGHTPEGAWCGVRDLSKNLKFANMQCRDDLEEATKKVFCEVQEYGWI